MGLLSSIFGRFKVGEQDPAVSDPSWGTQDRPVKFHNLQEPAGWNPPPAHMSTGITNVWRPKGLSAPIPKTRPDVILDQRLSERIIAFEPRLAEQTYLRQETVVQEVPHTVPANHLQAPGAHYQNQWPNKNSRMQPGRSQGPGGVGAWSGPGDQVGAISPGGSSGGGSGGGSGRYSMTSTQMGMYQQDYTQQTAMGKVHIKAKAAPRGQNVKGYADVQNTVIINGQYSQINGNLADMYLNLRAPRPFEGLEMGVQ